MKYRSDNLPFISPVPGWPRAAPAPASDQLIQTTQQNAAGSEQLASTAEQMSSQAEELQQAMSFFRVADSLKSTAASSSHSSHGASRQQPRPSSAPRHAPAPRQQEFASTGPDETKFVRY